MNKFLNVLDTEGVKMLKKVLNRIRGEVSTEKLIKIGNDVIIGAGSVVSKNIESNAVYAGNPAKYITSYTKYIEKNKKMINSVPTYTEEYTLRKNISSSKKEEMYSRLQDGIGFVK